MTRRHLALVVVVVLLLASMFVLVQVLGEETDPEQSTPPTATATP